MKLHACWIRRIPRVYKENDETTAVVNILRKNKKLNRYDSVFLFLTNEKCSIYTV